MKNKKHFLLYFSLCLIALTSCKKEQDNPNITHRTVNLEMILSSYNANSEMSIDINDDGMLDFEIELDLYKYAEDDYDYEGYIDYEQSGNELLTNILNSEEYIKPLNQNDLISGGSSTWYRNGYIFEVEKTPGNPETKYGYAGSGDILVGIRFLIGTELHYGWMKININTNYKTIKVKELAYDIRPNVEVKAGEK
ncbi:MAG: hypothetical protein R2807_02680 [Chitinophagales bacterium]